MVLGMQRTALSWSPVALWRAAALAWPRGHQPQPHMKQLVGQYIRRLHVCGGGRERVVAVGGMCHI
jgi:hypothetical protein